MTGGAIGATLSGKVECLCACEDRASSPTGLVPRNSWLISKSPYQQLVDDKELIVDKVVLINKEP